MLRGAALTVGAGALVGGGYVYADPGLRRTCRFWGRAGPVVGHYVATDVWHRLVMRDGAAEQQAAFAALHERYADRVLDTIQDLRGIFIKLGQVMSTRPELVPEAYRKRLQALQSGAPSEPLDVVERVIEQEFGRPAHELFSHIEAEPCGAASIGQAHIATLRVDGGGGDADGVGGGEGEGGGADGRQVVVKVQYPDAEAMFLADIQSIVLLSSTFYPESAPFMKEFAYVLMW
jgi:aarF domain-containing kinase